MNREIRHQEKITFKNKTETMAFILKLAKNFQKRQIVLLEGEMGVGKTQLVSWLASHYTKAKASTNDAASPTYAFHHSYEGEHCHIEHFDLDRIQSESDLESIGFWDIFSNETSWVIVEWPDRINVRHLPKNWPLVHLKISRLNKQNDNEERSLEVIQY